MGIDVMAQGEIVARSLQDYLHRHADIAQRIRRPVLLPWETPAPHSISCPDGNMAGRVTYLTTESAEKFVDSASLFLKEPIMAHHIDL